jgi:hypothetical protein
MNCPFNLIDTPAAAGDQTQVETAGDSLRCAAISPSGEAIAFGGSGGYLHLWSASHQPRISARSRQQQRLVHPVRKVRHADLRCMFWLHPTVDQQMMLHA